VSPIAGLALRTTWSDLQAEMLRVNPIDHVMTNDLQDVSGENTAEPTTLKSIGLSELFFFNNQYGLKRCRQNSAVHLHRCN
jgi:hypothetical protein